MEIKHNHVCFHSARNYSVFNTLKTAFASAAQTLRKREGPFVIFNLDLMLNRSPPLRAEDECGG